VALATTLVAPGTAASWGGEPLAQAPPAGDDRQIAAIPQPPEPPPVPVNLIPIPEGATEAAESQPAEMAPAEPPAPETVAIPPDTRIDWSHPIFDDPRGDVLIRLAPGIPVPSYPVVVNAQVEASMDYFTARERERFGLWISRSGRYLGMIRRVFREHGLPEDLAYTAMIESGFSPRAVSRVGAKGMWQFMEATGRRYGLIVNRWVDERLDPVKATVAAAQYLADLYGMFGHWFLAQAAYNAGEAKIARAMKMAKTSDFWALTQTRHLPNETKRFVPQILAAAVITQAPSRFGFEVAMESPLEYDEVTVKRALDFETIATLADVPVDDVRALNPALRGGITPPFGSYTLRLPAGRAARFEAALDEAAPGRLVAWGLHRIARNQTLAEIARLYRTSPQRLAEVNQLVGGRLRGVTELLVPVSNKVAPVASGSPVAAGKPVAPRAVRSVPRATPKPVPVRIAQRDDRAKSPSR
jgi:membrane-bound lytic murein transglycosylase D